MMTYGPLLRRPTCRSYRAGFTLVELIIVIVVIAVLAAIVIVSYNGITRRTSDSTAKSDMGSIAQKLETDKISAGSYPLSLSTVSGSPISVGTDIRTEYNSDGTTYCLTVSSVIAKTDYFQTNTSGAASGVCPNHLGYQGGAGMYDTGSIFGSSAPTGSYQVYSDGGGSLWVGDRFYTTLNNGLRIVGARVWEPSTATPTFLNTPISIQVYTQDWQGSNLGGWNNLPAPAITATYSGPRVAGAWTYIWFNAATTLSKVYPTAGQNDMATVAVRYDGNNYVAANPPMGPNNTQSLMNSGVYLSEDGQVGRSVSNVYPTTTGSYYYGIDMLFTPL